MANYEIKKVNGKTIIKIKEGTVLTDKELKAVEQMKILSGAEIKYFKGTKDNKLTDEEKEKVKEKAKAYRARADVINREIERAKDIKTAFATKYTENNGTQEQKKALNKIIKDTKADDIKENDDEKTIARKNGLAVNKAVKKFITKTFSDVDWEQFIKDVKSGNKMFTDLL